MNRQEHIGEYAARQCENAVGLFQVDAIAALITDADPPTEGDILKAQALVDGIAPLFQALAESIRVVSKNAPQVPMSEREKQIVDLTIQQVHDELYKLVANPAKNPRVSGETIRKSIWWKDVAETLDRLRTGAGGLERETQEAERRGILKGLQKAASHIRSMKGYVKDPDPRWRKPEEYAEEVEKLEP